MKTFKQFQESIFDFLPKGKFIDQGFTDEMNKKYNMPMIKTKPPKGGYRMPMPPFKFQKPNPYKTTLV